jgi:hypothetical protein
MDTLPEVGFFEIHAENYMGAGGPPHRCLTVIRETYPLSLHGVGLSIGAARPLDKAHLGRLKALNQRYQPGLFSEHLAWSTHDTVFYNDLLPLPYNEDTVARVADHVDEVQNAVGRRMLLENPSAYIAFVESTMSEIDFLKEVVRRAGCGLLLDVNNVYVNAVNHGRAPRDVLFELPLDRVRQIHLAGHEREDDILLDNHGSAVCDEVWALYREVLERVGPKPTLIEWDTNIPPLDRVLDEADRARDILHDVCSGARAGFDPLENRDVAL